MLNLKNPNEEMRYLIIYFFSKSGYTYDIFLLWKINSDKIKTTFLWKCRKYQHVVCIWPGAKHIYAIRTNTSTSFYHVLVPNIEKRRGWDPITGPKNSRWNIAIITLSKKIVFPFYDRLYPLLHIPYAWWWQTLFDKLQANCSFI